MPEDLYADAASPVSPEQAQPEPDTTDETSGSNETAELPKSILGGKKFEPGDEVVLEVLQINEDSVTVRYATGKGEGEEASEGESEGYGGGGRGGGMGGYGGGEMASMME